jgi:hypothetical protein
MLTKVVTAIDADKSFVNLDNSVAKKLPRLFKKYKHRKEVTRKTTNKEGSKEAKRAFIV